MKLLLAFPKNAKKIALLCSLFCVFFMPKTQANETEWTPNLKQAYQDVLSLRINAARQLLVKENDNNGLKIYVEDLADAMQTLFTDDAALETKWKSREDIRLNALDKLDEKSPYKQLLKAEVRFHWAVVKMNNGEEVAAAWDFIKCFYLIKANKEQFPNFKANLKLHGLSQVLLGSVPEQYKWISKILGLNGNVKTGLQELEELANGEQDFSPEARIYHAYIQTFILQNTVIGLDFAKKLTSRDPKNLLSNFMAISICLKANEGDLAEDFLNAKPSGDFLQPAGYKRYEGEIRLQQLHFSEAITAYTAFSKLTKGKSYLKDACLKTAFCQHLLGNSKEAIASIEKINTIGSIYKEKDKVAQSFAKEFKAKGLLPNKTLLKARFLFDGGYFEESMKELNTKTERDFTINTEKAEYFYRMGRVLQLSNEETKSILNFKKSMAIIIPENDFFAANSALQIGYILQKQNKKEEAKIYFKKAIDFNNNPNRSSIEAKAKAAMNL